MTAGGGLELLDTARIGTGGILEEAEDTGGDPEGVTTGKGTVGTDVVGMGELGIVDVGGLEDIGTGVDDEGVGTTTIGGDDETELETGVGLSVVLGLGELVTLELLDDETGVKLGMGIVRTSIGD